MSDGLKLSGISKSFGPAPVLDDISLDVAPGEFLSLVGPSGCGKSTLLRILSGLELQDRGSVSIGGRPVDHLGPSARNIAMVFQSYALYPHMSAFDNIAVPLTMSRLSLAERLPLIRRLSPRYRRLTAGIAADVRAVAAQLKIEPLLGRRPGQLSGGQRQRVALARAMVRQPSLFLMDEPLSNLDAQLRVHMRDELADLHARLGATFVYVTHDQVEAMTMSDRVAMLEGGRLLQVGKPAELYERPATLSVARFIGSPAINVLPGEVDADGIVAVAGQPSALRLSAVRGTPVAVGIRPEALTLRPGPGGALTGHVRRNEHHGSERHIHLDLAGDEPAALVARVPSDAEAARLEHGDTVSVSFDPARMHVFDAEGRRIAAELAPERQAPHAAASPAVAS
ncbi:MAG: glycerol-3-phosphate ABC transporter ATP-binding protein [Chelatococcus sp.]|nr:MAG: glycerol-3-phosphate ABC transporter ATP-binding protein [Chelatococcus sp.]